MFVILNQDVVVLDVLTGNNVIMKADSEVYLDLDENVAFCDGIHFDIAPDEYNILN